MNELVPKKSGSEFLLYQTEDGRIRIETRMQEETVWLTLSQMSELFERDKSSISRHIRNIYEEGELEREATVAKNATVQTEGDRTVIREGEMMREFGNSEFSTKPTNYCNLDIIGSGGRRRDETY